MFQYGRLDEIFSYIRKQQYITSDHLAGKFNVTDRTIRNDIQEINNELELHKAIIKLKRKAGYYIEIIDEEIYNMFLEELDSDNGFSAELDSSKDRIKYILNMLLSAGDYISADSIMDEVFISKNTLNNYIKVIKSIIEKYDLEYIVKPNAGIKIIGTEDNKRKCIMDNIITYDFDNYITGFTKEERTLFKGIDLDYLKGITLNQMHRRNIEISDYNIKNLIIHLALMITRVKSDNYISGLDVETDYSIMCIVDSLCKDIEEHFDVVISKGEKTYIYLHIVANTHVDATNMDDNWIKTSINIVLDRIHEGYNIDLREDEILLEDLFRHLKSIFTSKAYDLNIRNPLLDTIKKNYPMAFQITVTSFANVFTEEPFTLNEEDLGYISVHIGAAIERCQIKIVNKKKVILVCGSGQATTRMLEARLNLYFPDKIEIIKFASYNEYMGYIEENLVGIDFVISTIPLANSIIPSVTVNFSLKNNDIEEISKFIAKLDNVNNSKDDQLFSDKLFVKLKEVENKEEVLRILYEKLNAQGAVNEDFFDSILEREKLGNTNMNDIFALAHPMKLCANETKVAVAILDKPVLWSEDETVQIIFMLAIKQEEEKDIEHLYDSFIEIVNDTRLQQKIIKSKDFEEFIKTIK